MNNDPFDFEDIGIDLTPLIDVVFMLLIFFIMTTTFSRPALDIVLPKSETAEQRADRNRALVISIKADGSLYHNDRSIGLSELAAILETESEALLDLHVDEKAPFEAFVKLVDIAKEKRGGRFVISTRTPQAQPN